MPDLYRLKVTVRDYLDFEVIGSSPGDVMDRFEAAIHKKAKRGGWSEHAQAEIDRIKPEWIERLDVGVWIDYEPA
ncbi:hypothetical protein CcrC1_gp320 [Caulobacter phage C1]|nr:hypothetical protein CcrC1_gp320 [Caulobacter phage C1]UTU08549.1 hypothetical protein CcrC2_gp321 [Caulobacter phage C2]UTU09065.1 hypothetical protein CcrJ4_gp316 [Caulobacter phage J4]UTU10182.1 hypothetical protein CcrRB23_gp320 [Caulobacter phage RB23]WGN97216.1 hypothetical protein [Bertelyvirus sp.]